jgi:hypothetical protein
VYKDQPHVIDVDKDAKSLLDIAPEIDLSRNTKDVVDELQIIINIKNMQQRVLHDFHKHLESILMPHKNAKWTMDFITRLSRDLDNRIEDLNRLRESAEQTEKAVSFSIHQWNISDLVKPDGRTAWLETATSWGSPGSGSC